MSNKEVQSLHARYPILVLLLTFALVAGTAKASSRKNDTVQRTKHLKVCSARMKPRVELSCGRAVLHIHTSAVRWIKNHRYLLYTTPSLTFTWKNRLKFHEWMIRRSHRWIREAEARLKPLVPHDSVYQALLCIHKYEGAWNDPDSPYWGGLQMDFTFQKTYGPEFLRKYGTADNWPIVDQLIAGRRAVAARGYSPWPNTARYCGLT